MKNKSGKPYLKGYPEFRFSISHTRNAIAIAFSSDEIGIDIEKIKPPDFRIAKRFFTSAEQRYIFYHENPAQVFYEIWTKKEAYTKYMGTGLSTSLNSFNVLDTKIDAKTYMRRISEYILSVFCMKVEKETPNFIVLEEDKIQNYFAEMTSL